MSLPHDGISKQKENLKKFRCSIALKPIRWIWKRKQNEIDSVRDDILLDS